MKKIFKNIKKLFKLSQLKLLRVTYSYMEYTKGDHNVTICKESNNRYICHIFLKDNEIWASTIKEIIFRENLRGSVYSASDIHIINIEEVDICDRKVIY